VERARDAAFSNLVRLQAVERLSIEGKVATVRVIDARQHVEQRRLAGAVGSDQTVDLAMIDREIDARERMNTAKALADARRGEQAQQGHLAMPVSSSRLRTADGQRPAGR
jgi:hypothetical protein